MRDNINTRAKIFLSRNLYSMNSSINHSMSAVNDIFRDKFKMVYSSYFLNSSAKLTSLLDNLTNDAAGVNKNKGLRCCTYKYTFLFFGKYCYTENIVYEDQMVEETYFAALR
jgi:hypothetical protein